MHRIFLLSPAVVVALAACGGEPPEELGGFALGTSQAEVLETARAAGSFSCRFMGTRPSLTTCEGATPEGRVRVLVRGDVTRSITLHKDPSDSDPQRTMRRFVRGFGDPAWQERPVPSRSEPVEGYQTLWLNEDTTRSVAATCAGTGLRPPCDLELAMTSPAAVQAKLDSLLGIRR
ncbi:MAG TPA: hypothetical protein VM778_12335 [Gemmatimonadota bacterium]|nr:hypothetical protein [Gemmatimonadota bacterium]